VAFQRAERVTCRRTDRKCRQREPTGEQTGSAGRESRQENRQEVLAERAAHENRQNAENVRREDLREAVAAGRQK
jgi:hypothetical protein